MNYTRRSNQAQDARSKNMNNRRRSSARDVAVATGRRCSLSTFTSTSRIRANSKGYLGRDYPDCDVEHSRPPLEGLPRICGYDDVTFDPWTVPPPSSSLERETSQESATEESIKQIPPPTEREIREILLRHVSSKFFYNKKVPSEMEIINVDFKPGFKYTLESFAESRKVAWSLEPYTGGTLDEPSSGTAADPWLLPCGSLPALFQNNSVCLDVPHTDFMDTCHACGGVGSRRCTACSAAGWERCSFCLGDGHKTSLQGHRERCFLCLGTGRKKCWKCCGDTIAACRGCAGTGQIRCFMALTITWTNHTDHFAIDSPEAPTIGKKLEAASGILIFESENKRVSPVPDSIGSTITAASSSLLEKHKSDLESQEKITMQRHKVIMTPVHCVTYEWRQQIGRFFIYGTQNEVFAPGYPESFCCCNLQ